MRSSRQVAAVLLSLLSLGIFSHGCGKETPYIGGQCETNDDCLSETQQLPGSACIDGTCQCADPSWKVCCARGEEDAGGCFVACRPCDECMVGTEGCPSGCQSDAECPGPADARCGVGRCIAGECTLDVKAGPLPSQVRGDCQRVDCTVTGEVEAIADPSDYYDDGNQCTTDFCDGATARSEPLFDGTTCPNSGAGRCLEGICVDCYQPDPSMITCPFTLVCDYKKCVPAHCVNLTFDPAQGETSMDCGGPCNPCPIGLACVTGADCQSGSCQGTCKAPTCNDGIMNNAETGVDCGAPSSCPLCGPGQRCVTGADCSSGVCWAGVCEAPSCFDGVRNGEEAGTDCGPVCSVPCP